MFQVEKPKGKKKKQHEMMSMGSGVSPRDFEMRTITSSNGIFTLKNSNWYPTFRWKQL